MYEEREEGPTSTEVTDKQISLAETPAVVPQEEVVQKEEKPKEQEEKVVEQEPQEKSSIRKKKQKKRVATYLSNILKQAEKNGNEINKITVLIQSLQKQTDLAGAGYQQSIKQVRSQIGQLQKQVTRIQNDIQSIRTTPATKTRMRKSASATTRPKFKKRKSITRTKIRRRTKK